jgi:hypothetical protein
MTDRLSGLAGLERLNVGSLQALGAADDFKLDRLAVVQRAIAIGNDRGEMYEYIFSGLALDETIALAGVEPLHGTLFFVHFLFLFSNESYLVLLSVDWAQKKAASLNLATALTPKPIQEQQTQNYVTTKNVRCLAPPTDCSSASSRLG